MHCIVSQCMVHTQWAHNSTIINKVTDPATNPNQKGNVEKAQKQNLLKREEDRTVTTI